MSLKRLRMDSLTSNTLSNKAHSTNKEMQAILDPFYNQGTIEAAKEDDLSLGSQPSFLLKT